MARAPQLTVGSLFSGIGGLDLGLERAGMRVIWHSEIDPYACRVLNKHWPEVPNHGNIKEINWASIERPDVLCGGYPCQPFSLAGQRAGEDDERHLWPWVREAIRVLRPRYAILENVRGHLSLGGLSVIGELAAIGYDAEWRIVSAASVGANHRRDRIIIVAYPHGQDESTEPEHEQRLVANSHNAGSRTPRRGVDRIGETAEQERENQPQSGAGRCSSDVADSDRIRVEGQGTEQQTAGALRGCQDVAYAEGCVCDEQHSGVLPETGGDEGIQGSPGGGSCSLAYADSRKDGRGIRSLRSDRASVFGRENLRRGTAEYAGWEWWETEPDVGRVAHGVSSRVDRLRGLGNAVVPQVAEIIGRIVVADWEAQHGA